jgi:hypothetical protein
MDDKRVAKELKRIYKKFAELKLGGKIVATPYRLNEMDQDYGPAFQGKSSPEVIIETATSLANKEQVKLADLSIDEIRKFLEDHKLGIDCSGFVYRMLDFMVKKIFSRALQDATGLDHVGNTNVELLTSTDFTVPIENISDIKPADIIKVHSFEKPPHCMIILEVRGSKILYAHSSLSSTPSGVHTSFITITDPTKSIDQQKWAEEYLLRNWNEELGDGVHRLKIMQTFK